VATDLDIYEEEKQLVEQIREGRDRLVGEISKVIIGQREVVEQLLSRCSPAGIA
jgi:MoxR-like ATPase